MLRNADKRLSLGRLENVVRAYVPETFEAVGAPSGTSGGTAVVSNASANTKGAYTELGTSTMDADGFYVHITPGTAARDFLIDIALGAASSEVDVVSNLLYSTGTTSTFVEAESFYVPVGIPAGSRISVRCQASSGTSQISIYVVLAKGDAYRRQRCQRATTYGANTADSGGTSLDPGGSANTDGGYSQLSAAITNPIRSVLICVGNQVNGARTDASFRFNLARGAGGSEVVVAPTIFARASTDHDLIRPHMIARDFRIEAGQRLAANTRCSITDATDRLIDIVVIGFD